MDNVTLITGANGFVGRPLLSRLIDTKSEIRVALRRPVPDLDLPEGTAALQVGEVGPTTNWVGALDGVKVVVHLAARVHVMRDRSADPLQAFRQVNTAGTLNLAKAAARSGVKRFVFVSTIKVNGEETSAGPFTANDTPAPTDPYAISKWEAEQGLREIEAGSAMEVVVVRPPLVYGPGVGGNFIRLLKLAAAGWPLPFGAMNNRRSMIYLENLVDALSMAVVHPAAAGRCFLVADEKPLSTPELFRRVAGFMGKKSRLFPVPSALLAAGGAIFGRSAEISRLAGSLLIDTAEIRERLDWRPPHSVEYGLEKTARWFVNYCQ